MMSQKAPQGPPVPLPRNGGRLCPAPQDHVAKSVGVISLPPSPKLFCPNAVHIVNVEGGSLTHSL